MCRGDEHGKGGGCYQTVVLKWFYPVTVVMTLRDETGSDFVPELFVLCQDRAGVLEVQNSDPTTRRGY